MNKEHNATFRGADNSKGQIKIQLFADGGEGAGEGQGSGDQSTGEGSEGDSSGDSAGESKTYTQEELDEMLQKETDRRVSGALDKAKIKFEKEYKEKLEQERQEAAKLAQLSESDKQKAIFEKQQAEFEQERSKFEREKLELEVTKQLASKNLPIEFANLLVGDGAESSLDNINAFEKSFQAALDKAVEERLKSKPPQGGGSGGEVGTGIGARLAKQKSESNNGIKENPYF